MGGAGWSVTNNLALSYASRVLTQMALRVWKDVMVERLKGPLVKALLKEIQR